MRHAALDRWSQRSSALHRRDARAKLVTLIVFLAGVASTPSDAQLAFAGFAALLLAGLAASHLPIADVLKLGTLVLPVSAVFALTTWWTGDSWRALAMLERSYLSACAALLFAGTTPAPAWAEALRFLRMPRALILTIQFVHRYLFVLADQAQRIRMAAKCRGGFSRSAAAGALGTLFSKSWQRAEHTSRAMIARGFRGVFQPAAPARFCLADALLIACAVSVCGLIRFGV